jgi:hypothetical protein
MAIDIKQRADGGASIVADTGAGKGGTIASLDPANYVFGTGVNTLARTDTSAKTLFTLPPNAVPITLTIFGSAVSNAGTSATISVGKAGGTGSEFLSAFDVKGSTGAGQQNPTAAANLNASIGTTALAITGTYAETGTASTSGGPWTVIMDYYVSP